MISIASIIYITQQNKLRLTSEDYARAERLLPWNVAKLAFNLKIEPHWVDKGSLFWYRSETPSAKEFVLIDPERNLVRPAFDQVKLAAALSLAASKTYEAVKLPFEQFDFVEHRQAIQFDAENMHWTCNLTSYECKKVGAVPIKSSLVEVVSPDERWAAFVRQHNLYVRSLVTKNEIQLTNDGRQFDDYAVSPNSDTHPITHQIHGDTPIAILWSPDAGKFVTYKLDQRKVKESYLIQSVPPGPLGAVRPLLYSYPDPFPGDANVAMAKFLIFDVLKKNRTVLDLPEQPVTVIAPIEYHFVWWSKNGKQIYFIQKDRWWKNLKLSVMDALTGNSHTILEEHGSTMIGPGPQFGGSPLVRDLNGGTEIIWFSERDGWGHLYLYDGKTGRLKNQITSGSWVVREIKYVDEPNRLLYFTASGREEKQNPYLRRLYRIRLDGSDIQLLTPENADHEVTFSPDGCYFVDTYSRVNTAPVSVLRSVDGNHLQKLVQADVHMLIANGLRLPEPFHVKAADGVTDIYGVIYRPSDFHPSKRYPVVDSIYPGPQEIRTPQFFTDPVEMGYQSQSLAELGFVVVTVDGRGTPYRSKVFHDYSYGRIGDAGSLDDHIVAIKQLAARYPYLDLNRVGIYGHSGGGYASVRAMLKYPDFYKVAVASSGEQDMRGYLAEWGETYEGPLKSENYLEASNPVLALTANLKGKLLIAWGDMDDNVPPTLQLQLISALIKANSDFDTLILPNRNHSLSHDPYFIRKLWDYFVLNLLDAIPPKNYQIKTFDPKYRTLNVPDTEK